MIELVETRGRGRSKVVDLVLIEDRQPRPNQMFNWVHLAKRPTERRVSLMGRTGTPAGVASRFQFPYWRIVIGPNSHAEFGTASMPYTDTNETIFLHPWDFDLVRPSGVPRDDWRPTAMCSLDPSFATLSCSPDRADLFDIAMLETAFQHARVYMVAR